MRLRATAVRIRLLTAKATCRQLSPAQIKSKKYPRTKRPVSKIDEISCELRMISLLVRLNFFLCSFIADGQALAPFGAPARQNRTAVFRAHSFPKSVRRFPLAIMRLKGSFHFFLRKSINKLNKKLCTQKYAQTNKLPYYNRKVKRFFVNLENFSLDKI